MGDMPLLRTHNFQLPPKGLNLAPQKIQLSKYSMLGLSLTAGGVGVLLFI